MRPKWAPVSSMPPPSMTKYWGMTRSPSRRTLPWKPMPAMWCWPQPLGQPLILIEIGGRGDEERALAQVIAEEPAQTA
jgi:hypothetical protein